MIFRKLIISTSGVPSMNKIDLQALSLMGLTVTRLVQDPLAVLSLDNQLSTLTTIGQECDRKGGGPNPKLMGNHL